MAASPVEKLKSGYDIENWSGFFTAVSQSDMRYYDLDNGGRVEGDCIKEDRGITEIFCGNTNEVCHATF